jgi:predicted transcriptional regulator
MSVTITVSDSIYKELSSLRRHGNESDEEIIQDLLYHAVDDEPLSEETLKAIDEGIEDIKAGRYRPLEEVI